MFLRLKQSTFVFNDVIFDVIFATFCIAMTPWIARGPYIRAVYTGVKKRPVHPYVRPVYTARIYGCHFGHPYIRVVCIGLYGAFDHDHLI